jgi:hypothetical protein
MVNKNSEIPSSFPKNMPTDIVANLQLIGEIFQRIEQEASEIAEEIFDHLIDATDLQIMTGTIPPHKNQRINEYIKLLNRLFFLSRRRKEGGLIIISRKVVEELDKKTFALCMCHDGGVFSLGILCEIANAENRIRTPQASPVKITVKNLFGNLAKGAGLG